MRNTMNYKKILFFCEKSKKKGGGHFIRAKRLMDVINGDYKKFFYMNLSQKRIKNLVKKNDNSIIVFDFKTYKKNIFINGLKNFYVIFDNKRKYLENSVNINPLEFKNKKFSGPKWFLYPQNFRKKIRKKDKKNKNLFICQGFTDAHDNLNKLVSLIIKSTLTKKIKIFVKVPYKNYLNKIHLRNRNVIEISKIQNLFNFLKKIDIAITSTGNFSYELGYLQIPCIYVSDESKEKKRGLIYQKKRMGKIFSSRDNVKIIEEFHKLCYNKFYNQGIKNNLKKYFNQNSVKNYLTLFDRISRNEKI